MKDVARPFVGRPNLWMALWGRRVVLEHWAIPALFASFLFLLWVAIYFPTLASLVRRWNADANYSHGYMVPLVSAFLLKQSLETRAPRTLCIVGGRVVGAIVLILALALSVGTVLVPSVIAESASMLIALAGLAILIGGWNWWRRLWAPIAFLVFMVPWPSELYSKAAFPLQLLASQVAAGILELCGLAVLREGNLIHLPGQTMHVAQACSGMRQLTAFLAIAACAALLVRRPMWYRVTLLASSVMIAFVVNVLRVTATGLVIYYFGASWTEGTLHTIEGLVMIGLGLMILLAEIQLLDWLLVPAAEETSSASPPPTAPTQTGASAETRSRELAILRGRLVVAVVLLAIGFGSRVAVARQFDSGGSSPSLAHALGDFPKQLGAWNGVDETPRKEVLDMMKLDDYLQRVYRHPSGQEVVLWISFSKTSRDQYHYPTVCMEGSGWTEEESERRYLQVAVPDREMETVQPLRMRFVKPDRGRQYVYYWYYLIGERDIDRAMRNLSRSTRLFLRGRSNASATVEIFTQSANVDVDLVDDLARRIALELDRWMPDEAWSQSLLGAN